MQRLSDDAGMGGTNVSAWHWSKSPTDIVKFESMSHIEEHLMGADKSYFELCVLERKMLLFINPPILYHLYVEASNRISVVGDL